jgi:EF-P beta-lysylation protein EpmB
MTILASYLNSPTAPEEDSCSWQEEVKRAIRDPVELCRRLRLPADFSDGAGGASSEFGLFVPRGYLGRIRPGDPNDPLLRQVLPLDEEMRPADGFSHDPVGDRAATLAPGLLQKYAGRALLVTTGACAIHCRYCFRRHFPYSTGPRGFEDWLPALRMIEADPSIIEVLLSGGDPLMLVDDQLDRLARSLAEIPHVARLRVHTRLPIVIPQRVNRSLLDWLCGTRLTPIVVVHANHPLELDRHVEAALARLTEAGVLVLNQAVLLRGVNDDADVLVELCQRLIEMRVMPYYLHQLDRVQGATHFEVPLEIGLRLMRDLRERLPGYAVPRYVRELAGQPYKTPLA